MATSKTEDDSTVIEDAIESEDILNNSPNYEDRISHTSFDDEGRAKANLYFDDCVSESQVESIRDSDIWKLRAIFPSSDGDGVYVHILEDIDLSD